MLVKIFFPIVLAFFLFSCSSKQDDNSVFVKDNKELENAITEASPGDKIVLANGIWKDVEIKFFTAGTKEKPITLCGETAGEVFIEGQSSIKFGADYITVSDLYFRNGYTPSNAVIEFKLNDKVANHCTFTNCVIENFNQPQRDRADHWVEFWGRYNELSNCNIIGKSNSGPTVRVQIKGNESIKNFHKIINNHFGPRPRKGGPHGETLQVGDSYTSMSPSNTFVAHNLFDRCNGEVEVISSKTNFNEFRNNVFYKCEGSLVMRHGNYCIIDGNYFIGDENSDNIGGIRIVNTGHWVTNNYFYKINGNNFRSALAIMNGIPKSPLNRYNQVTDVVVAYNTWVDCKSPWQFSVGTNVSQKDVLPASEIRSARPIRTVVANNVIYNPAGDSAPIVAYEKVDGVEFKKNIINNQNVGFQKYDGLDEQTFEMKELAENIFVPSLELAEIEPYSGFDFDNIENDIFGNKRLESNWIGAVSKAVEDAPAILDDKMYGANWYSTEKAQMEQQKHTVSADANNLESELEAANFGDIIELQAGTYQISAPLVINKNITIQSANQKDKAQIVYTGQENTALFEMHPNGNILVKDIVMKGNELQFAFASLQKNMSAPYNVKVIDCEFSNFNYVLKAYKESFADEISFSGSKLSNCENGIELSGETDDTGDYNVEFLTIDNCQFKNIKSNVIDYYRGGYDESTIGGNLKVSSSAFVNCGARETNGILLNTRGIINVDISKNTFKNNPVKLVALLWGAKNNSHSDNEIVNSGKIVVQENIKLTLMY